MILSSLDFMHAVFAKANADGFERPGWTGTFMVGMYMFPPSAFAFGNLGFANSQLDAVFSLVPCMSAAWVYSRVRAQKLRTWFELLPDPQPVTMRLVAVLFVLGGILSAFLLSEKSALLAGAILLAVAAIPWPRLVGVRLAP
ncbi:hypothetical protein GCM10028862_02990 [Luteimonas pelagia]